jgi:DNA polymerase III subunit gamma/tau
MSYQVIARKYRPQIFDEVVGQNLVTETLANAIRTNRVAHSYIFSGARGVGKTTTARILAKALNCAEGPTVSPCGKCASCTEIAAGNSVDVLEIDAASNRGIDEIRELRETVRYLPARDRYRVFIIDEVHMLTTEAFNALLKTLEEPPPRSLFILATTEPHKLPSTIQSRCQHFAFRLLDYNEIVAQLEKVARAEKLEADEGAMGALAQAAEGSLRDALSLLDQAIAACGEKLDEARVRQILGAVPARLLSEMMEAIEAGNSAGVLEQVSKLATEGYELTHFIGEFTRFVRNLMIAKTAGVESRMLQVPSDEREAHGRLAKLFSEEDLTRFLQILLRTESELRYALDPRFHLELGMLKLVHARRLASVESLLTELSGAGSGAKAGPAATARPVPETKLSRSQHAAEAVPRREAPSVPPPPATPSPAAAESTAPAVIPHKAPADERLAAIKELVFGQSKLLGSCLEPLVAWRFENGEARFLYSKEGSWAADLLKSREQMAKLESACAQVLGQPVKICVTLEEREAERPAQRPAARERALGDKMVQVFSKAFDATMVEVEDLSQE